MTPIRQDRRVARVIDALRAQGGRRRSPLFRWMRKHHDALATAFAELPPAWQPLSEELAAIGLKDARGHRPTAATARATWRRVRRDVACTQASQPAATPTLAPDETALGVHLVANHAPATSPPADDCRECALAPPG
jgi:hypothetical protein